MNHSSKLKEFSIIFVATIIIVASAHFWKNSELRQVKGGAILHYD